MTPRDRLGRFVSRNCPLPECGNGTLQYEGEGYWRCDGLADPGHPDLDLIACEYAHSDHPLPSPQRSDRECTNQPQKL